MPANQIAKGEADASREQPHQHPELPWREQERLADEFVTGLEKLTSDRAALARLKRCSGRSLAECPDVYPIFYRLLPGRARGRSRLEDTFFLTATLFPLFPQKGQGDLGASLGKFVVRNPRFAAGVERRLGILLDSGPEDLPFRLRQVVVLLASHDIGTDWRQLTVDLLQWKRSSRTTHKRWARSFFGTDDTTAASSLAKAERDEPTEDTDTVTDPAE